MIIQHHVVVFRMSVVVKKRKRVKAVKTTKWKLRQKQCEKFREMPKVLSGKELPDDWATTSAVIRVTSRRYSVCRLDREKMMRRMRKLDD